MGETTRDLFLYGGLALGSYFIVKSLTEPLSKPIDAISDLATKIIGVPQYIWDNGGLNYDNINKTKKMIGDTSDKIGTVISVTNPLNWNFNNSTPLNWDNIPSNSLGVKSTLSPQVQALANGMGSYTLNGGLFVNPSSINPLIVSQLQAGTYATSSNTVIKSASVLSPTLSSNYSSKTYSLNPTSSKTLIGKPVGYSSGGVTIKSSGKSGLYLKK